MLTTKQIDKIKEAICNKTKASPDTISNSSHLRDDLRLDAYDEVEIMLSLEKEFSVRISDEKWERVQTFGELCDAIDQARILKQIKNPTYKDEIDMWLFEEMNLMPGCCSAQLGAEYQTAREVAEKLWPRLIRLFKL